MVMHFIIHLIRTIRVKNMIKDVMKKNFTEEKATGIMESGREVTASSFFPVVNTMNMPVFSGPFISGMMTVPQKARAMNNFPPVTAMIRP